MTMFLISYKAFLTHEIIAECTAAIVNFTTVRDTLKAICHTMKRLQGTTAAHTYTENIRLTVASVMAVYKEQNTFDVLRIGRSVLNFWAWNGGIDPCDPLLKRASEIKRLQRGLYSVGTSSKTGLENLHKPTQVATEGSRRNVLYWHVVGLSERHL
eukprot:m.87555 g.87555  ORF g.87555 m.87555 type:complete len:156 (-) comp16412_c1_seq3:475-942(-)